MPKFIPPLVAIVMAVSSGCAGPTASQPMGEPVLEEPTLRSLGVYWIVRGDQNGNARVEVSYRQAGAADWRRGADLFRVGKGHTWQQFLAGPGQRLHEPELNPPGDCWLLAGSILMLQPATEYEIRLKLTDPDGGGAERVLKARTIGEPVAPKPLRTLHVVPLPAGQKPGGTGTEADPFRGLAAAEEACKPGDLILVHKGVYNEALHMVQSGEREHPIIWQAAGDGEAVIDGQDKLRLGVQAWLVHDVWFEGLTIRGVHVGISANDSHHIVIRRNHITPSMYGICFNGNQTGQVSNFFVSDNVIEGPCKWPRTKGIENPGGMYLTGRGHVVCYNRVHNFADGIDCYRSKVCAAIDIHNNDISECTDDGSEMDFTERNCRNFENRYTNVFQGVSEQPIFGGPTYIFRNTLYNVGLEPFKLHHNGTPKSEVNWAPSGAIIFHNTIVKKGMPSVVWSSAPVFNCVSRNNLYVGTEANYACEFTCQMADCDFDYDGFAGMLGRHPSSPAIDAGRRGATAPAAGRKTPYDNFLNWNGVQYKTLADVKARSPAERHAVAMDSASVFASGLLPPADDKTQFENTAQDLRLKPGSAAIDAGEVLPGLNDGFAGKAPDLGGIELGSQPPHYGPRPLKQ
ncbi:MAG: right-handed parallel beta-helix repeat-containing protein [Phycisphaerae bacterium]